MQYRKDRQGREISLLGYGCMRLSRSGAGIDLDKAAAEIRRAAALGVNYFDTAYTYPGSEEALGTILEREGLRDKVNIATKLPQYLVNSASAIDKYFREELRRLRTDHIDYYLIHMLTDLAAWLTTGISTRSSTITWTSTARPDVAAWRRLRAAGSP